MTKQFNKMYDDFEKLNELNKRILRAYNSNKEIYWSLIDFTNTYLKKDKKYKRELRLKLSESLIDSTKIVECMELYKKIFEAVENKFIDDFTILLGGGME